ncbi:MAG: potassium transporter Kup [Dongiaceae bacterium]
MSQSTQQPPESTNGSARDQSGAAKLLLGVTGVVFGDIGTSPLYALRQALDGQPAGEAAVLGVLSLIFWALFILVTIKYVTFILRADNRGEGGVLALAAVALRGPLATGKRRTFIIGISILGLTLFGGDGLITPAISVLSAVEGLNVMTPVFEPFIAPIAVAILVALFVIQRHGTAQVGRWFGPIMLAWFVCLAVLGVAELIHRPGVLRAINPLYAVELFQTNGVRAFVILGSIVLAVTGAEALYADMGHFGRPPIRRAWFGLVFPALTLNYFGQGALVLSDPGAQAQPFFLLAPGWAIGPLVLLATLATVIASQAVITGAFSMTRQAVQLGYLPRMAIRHTSETEIGQIYLPRVNWIMMLGVIALVLGFGSSSNLAGAYGIAVTGSMAVDSVLAGLVAWWLWRWSPLVAGLVFGVFLLIDLAFLTAACLKIPAGGWFPLLTAVVGFTVVMTWRRGRRIVYERLYRDALPIADFLARFKESTQRVAGTAVFMTANVLTVPNAFLHNMKHNKVVHERVVIMTVATEDVPRVPPERRIEVNNLGKGFYAATARFGFMESPNVPQALALAHSPGLALDMMQISFFLGHETLVPSRKPDLPMWQEQLFITLTASALSATSYFNIPPGRVVELGVQIEV